MTRRKGEITERQIRRQWPHHVALLGRSAARSGEQHADLRTRQGLGGAPIPYHSERDGRDLRAFCFATADAAQTFAERFGGELLPVVEGQPERRRPRR